MFAIELNNTDGKYSRRDTLTSILSTNYAKASNDVVTTATRFAMQIKRAAISCACCANSAVLETWTIGCIKVTTPENSLAFGLRDLLTSVCWKDEVSNKIVKEKGE